jgi:hypothetical protein
MSYFNDDNLDNGGDQDDGVYESIHSAESTDQVKTKPRFDHRDVAVLKSTNGLLCPGDAVSYHIRNPRGKPKVLIIASLLDPSTLVKKVITLEIGVIFEPFVHDIKQEKMYGGGACRHLTDPLSLWSKMEQSILLVRCTSIFSAFDKDDNDNDINDDDDVNDDDNNDNCDFIYGKHSIKNIFGV